MAFNGQCLHACHRLLADDGTDDWVSPQSHGPLMPTVFCNLYLYLYLTTCAYCVRCSSSCPVVHDAQLLAHLSAWAGPR
jgi:hypothetical protein